MTITANGWKNKGGTAGRSCSCGSWKEHWINQTGESWPKECSVKGCSNRATLGAHIINPDVEGEKIVPACDSCNKSSNNFDLKGRISVVSANKLETCQKV